MLINNSKNTMLEIFNILIIAFVFLTGFAICSFASKLLKIPILNVIVLYLWHSLFCILYYYFTLEYGGDAQMYYSQGANEAFQFGVGTAGIVMIVYILAKFFYFSEIAVYLVFNAFGVMGVLLFFHCLRMAARDKSRYVKKLIWVIILLPSVSYWSSAIGKDSLSFLAVTLSMWSALELRNRMFSMLAAIGLMLFVRPHMAGMMVIALAVAALLERQASVPKKIFMGILSASAAALMVPFALTYAGVGDVVDVGSVSSYIDTRQSYNMEGGGGIDIASMSLPEQLFAYMFRPLIFEVNSIFSAAAALDNLILLFLFVSGGWAILKGRRSDLGESRVFMWVYATMTWGLLAMTTANLGIALRQKWMFAPILIFLFISVMGRRRLLSPAAPLFKNAAYASVVRKEDHRRQR